MLAHRKLAHPVVWIALLSAANGLLYGYNLGVISGAILFITQDFNITGALREAAMSASLLGAMLGAVAGGHLADRIGRRPTLFGGAGICVAAAIVGAASPDASLLIASRLSSGFSFGVIACVTPIFLVEIAPPRARGRVGALFSVTLMVGLLTSYLVDLALSGLDEGWRLMVALGALPALPLVLFLVRLPESPRWHLAGGSIDAARAGFTRLLGAEKAGLEIAKVTAAGPALKGRFGDLFGPLLRSAVFAAVALAAIRQGTGAAISTFYAPELLAMAGFSSVRIELLGTVGVGAIYVVMTLVALALVDRLGRRPLMLVGLFGMAASLTVLAVVLHQPAISPALGTVAVASLFVFSASFAIGPGAVVFLLISELLPQHVRGLGMGMANLVLWATYLASTLTFHPLVDEIGKANTFAIYAGLCVAALAFVTMMVPETRGQNLEDIKA